MRPSKTVLKRASKARRAASRSTFQKLLRDRASFKMEEARLDALLYNKNAPSEDTESERSFDSRLDLSEDFQSLGLSRKSWSSSQREEPSLKGQGGKQRSSLPKGITGPFWEMKLVPLSKKEENSLISNGRIFGRSKLAYGEYKVAPDRYDLQVFHRKFWISRAIRQLLAVVCTVSNKSIFKKDLLEVRSIILKYLGNGTKRQTSIQRKLLSSVYFCLRQVQPTISRG